MGLKVLVIEDSPLMRKLIHKALRQSSVAVDETVEASNGEEGLKCLQESSPDVILCDWNMPVMGGQQFIEELRTQRDYDRLKVMVVTSESNPRVVYEALKAGADEYAMKPITPEIINGKLEMMGLG